MKPREPAPLEDVLAWAESLHAEGRTLVSTNGCFDLFHAGHLQTLYRARSFGDALVVLVNSDASVRRYKGPERPFIDEGDRARLLMALRPVDQVIVFPEDTPLRMLERLRPHVHVKGGSFDPERIRKEAECLRAWGGRLECLELVEGLSSTVLIQKIRGEYPKGDAT